MIKEVLNEIEKVLSEIDETNLENFSKNFDKSKRIYVYGAGRSFLQLKGFAMRLMHIGYDVVVVGETITPAIKEGDLLVLMSGSGETKTVLYVQNKAKSMNVKTIAVTCDSESSLAKNVDDVLVIPGATRGGKGQKSIQLLSSLFDQSAHIVLDVLCLYISKKDNTSNDYAKKMHSNLE